MPPWEDSPSRRFGKDSDSQSENLVRQHWQNCMQATLTFSVFNFTAQWTFLNAVAWEGLINIMLQPLIKVGITFCKTALTCVRICSTLFISVSQRAAHLQDYETGFVCSSEIFRIEQLVISLDRRDPFCRKIQIYFLSVSC